MNNHRPLVALFTGERYADAKRLSERLAPPYDVVSADERETLARRDPHNIIHLTLPAENGDRYARAATLLAEWREAGVLVPDKAPCVYVVRQSFTTPAGSSHVRTGIIGAVAVEPYATRRVKPHETTNDVPKEDRLALMRSTSAMFEALLMLTRDESGTLVHLLEEATEKRETASAKLRAVSVSLWRVQGRRAQALADAAGQGALYLADGHHRYETAIAYHEERASANQLPALIVPQADPGLVVLPTHRIVYGVPVNGKAIEHELRDRFQIRELPREANYLEELTALKSRGTACIVVLPGEKAAAFLLKGGASLGDLPFAEEPAVAGLDVARIDEIVVKRLSSMAGESARVDYSADAHHVIDEVRSGAASAGVLLNATPVEDVLAVADADVAMPPKSTYFTPKVPSGLVIMSYG